MTIAILSKRVWDAWRVPEPIAAEEWIPEHIQIPSNTETPGPFDLDKFPHVYDVLATANDPAVREILLAWAARNTKTTTCISLMMFWMKTDPRPGLFCSSKEEKTDDTIQNQYYPMLEACDETRRGLLPPMFRNKLRIVLPEGIIRRAFSGSADSLAGFPACYIHRSEVSKWSKRKSSEADPIYLILQRAKLFPFNHKILTEGTPGHIADCNMTTLCNAKDVQRRLRWVPCTKCGTYQVLEFGDQSPKTPGIKWDGDDDPIRAEETAWYRCVKGCRIENDDRPEMMRNGVWLPEGQKIGPRSKKGKRGRITGKPLIISDKVCFGPPKSPGALSTLYSLAIAGWGQIAREYLDAQNNPKKLQDFYNSTLGLPWDPTPQNIEAHELGALLRGEEPKCLCPEWTLFLTLAYDCQTKAAGIEWPWSVMAWGWGGRCHLVDYGTALDWNEIEELFKNSLYEHGDGGDPLRPAWSSVDSGDGNMTEKIYDFCRRHKRMVPIKGGNHPFTQPFVLTELTEAQRRQNKFIQQATKRERLLHGHGYLVIVNTIRSQDWLQARIDGYVGRDDEGGLTLCQEAADDEGLLEELLNEVGFEDTDKRGFPRKTWKKRRPNMPNDHRDLLRYHWTLAMIATNGGSGWWQYKSRAEIQAKTEAEARKPRRRKRSSLGGGGREWRHNQNKRR